MAVKNITIVGNGEDISDEKLILMLKKSDFIIASDGGLNSLSSIDIKPDMIVGDLDSARPEILDRYRDIETVKFPPEKDLTDSELAIKKALELNPETITLFGMTGSYIDHSLANINLLVKYSDNSVEINLVNRNSTVFIVKNHRIFTGMKGRRISLFPVTPVPGLKLSGFRYVFEKIDLGTEDYSISNVISENNAEINFNEGKIVCIVFDEGYD